MPSRPNRPRGTAGLVAALLVVVAGLVVITKASGASTPTAPTATTPRPSTATEGDRMDRALAALRVIASRPDVPGYERDCGRGDGCVFGPAWKDTDRNGCDTRNDTLRRDLTAVTTKPGTTGCKVTSGRLTDPYSGAHVVFSTADPDAIEIDHILPLKAAWDYGANRWPIAKRERFANDPRELAAVTRAVNRAKSDATPGDQLDPHAWRPTTPAGRCLYGSRYVTIAAAYDLPISRADRAELQQALADCKGNR